MTDERNNGGPAFPSGSMNIGDGDTQAFTPGMTLRDWFAGQALAGLVHLQVIHKMAQEEGVSATKITAEAAYEMADAMLKARK